MRLLHHTLALGRGVVLMSHAVCQQILGPTARRHDVFDGPVDTSRSSIACGLLYSVATRLSNLGIGTFFDLVHFFNTPGILSLPYQFYHHACCFVSRPAG